MYSGPAAPRVGLFQLCGVNDDHSEIALDGEHDFPPFDLHRLYMALARVMATDRDGSKTRLALGNLMDLYNQRRYPPIRKLRLYSLTHSLDSRAVPADDRRFLIEAVRP